MDFSAPNLYASSNHLIDPKASVMRTLFMSYSIHSGTVTVLLSPHPIVMGHKARPLSGKPETKEADEDTWQKPQPTPISGTAISVPGDWGERDSKGTAGLRRGVGTLQSESGLRKGSSWPRSRLPGRRWGSWHEKRWKGRMGQWSATGKKEATKGDTVSALTRGRSERLQVKRARRWAYLKATKAARKEAADEKFRAAWVAEARELWERDQEFEYLRQAGADERVEADESGPLEEANSIAEQEVLCGDTDGEVGADSGGWGQVDKEAGSGLGSNESEPVGPAAEEGGAREEEGNGTWCRCGAGVNAEGGTLPAIVVLVMRRRCIRWKARKWKKGGMDRRCPARIARRGKKQAEGQGQNEDGKQGQTEQAAERSGGGGMTWRGDKKAKRRAKKAAAREAKRQARRKVLMGKLKRFKMWGQDRKASAVGALLDKLPRGDEVAASKRRKWEKGATKRERIRAARDAELAEWLGLAGPASAILTTRRTITAHRRPLAKPPAPTPNSQTLKKSSPTLPPTTSPEAGLPGVGDLTLKPAAVTNGTPAVESVVAQPREPLSLDACTSLAAAKSPTAEPAVSPAGADLPMPVRAAPSEEEKDTAGEGCRPIGVEASAPLAGCEASTEVATATPGGNGLYTKTVSSTSGVIALKLWADAGGVDLFLKRVLSYGAEQRVYGRVVAWTSGLAIE